MHVYSYVNLSIINDKAKKIILFLSTNICLVT